MACKIDRTSNRYKELMIEFNGSEDAVIAAMLAEDGARPEDFGTNTSKHVKKPKDIKFKNLYINRKNSLKNLNDRLSRVEQSIKSATPSEKVELHRRSQLLRRNIEKLEKEMLQIRKLDTLFEIEEFALADMAELDAIFSQEEITVEDLNYAKNKINIWLKAGDFDREHLFFTREELEASNKKDDPLLTEIREKFAGWANDAKRYESAYFDVTKEVIENNYREEFDFDGEVNFDELVKDKNWMFSNLVGISEADHPLLQLMFTHNKKANFDAHVESLFIMKEVENLFKDATSKMSRKELYELFKQNYSNTDNRETGNMVFRWTQSYFDAQRDLRNKLYSTLENIDERTDLTYEQKSANKNKAYANYVKALKNNTISVDVRKIFAGETIEIDGKQVPLFSKEKDGVYYTEFTPEEIQAHKDELKKHLGEKGYDFYIKEAREKLDKYKNDYIAQRSILDDNFNPNVGYANIEAELQHWEMTYSPFYNSYYYNNKVPRTKIRDNWVHSSAEYMTTVARKFDLKGKDTGFYDNKYKKIEADETTLKLYNYILEITNELTMYLPPDSVKFMQVNSLPEIRKTILESFMSDGIHEGLRAIKDAVIESTRIDDLETVSKEEAKDEFGKPRKELQMQFLINNSRKINDYVKNKQIRYEQEHGTIPKGKLRDLRVEWKKEITDELSKEKSWDIEKIIKAYAIMALTYKHKARIQDSMQLTSVLVDRLRQAQTNKAGEQMYTAEEKEEVDEEGNLKHLKQMVNNYMDLFYGYSTVKQQGKMKKRVYTSKELAKKKELEELRVKNAKEYQDKRITAEKFLEIEEALEKQLNNLGGQMNASKFGNWILKYMQIKGMGWNVFSAFSNIGFGTVANFVEADGGQRFNRKQLWKAYRLILSSIGKNYTFDQMGGNTATKIRNLMDKLDVLKESKNEIYQTKMWKNKFKFLDAYNMQSRGEYINQGTLMIAIMLNTKVPGTNINLWEAYDTNGELKEDVKLPKDFEFKVSSKIDEAIRYTHGNYDPNAKLDVKDTFLGKAASQFRTWAYMGFYSRFGSTDKYKTHSVGFVRKGRYRSYATMYNQLGKFSATIELTKQLLRKMAFQKTTFDEKFDEIDAANLRKNLTEIAFLAITTSVALMLKSLAKTEDGDDDEELWRFLAIFWVNQMSRLSNDILLYTSPSAFDQIQRQAVPVFTVVVDASKLISHVASLTVGGEDEYQAGLYRGQSKTWRYSKNLIPGLAQWNRLQTTAKRIY